MQEHRFGEWLKAQLLRREWTQADLARRLDTDTGTISRWATGQRLPDPSSCDRLADILGVDIARVMELAGHLPEMPSEEDEALADLHSMLRRMKMSRVREKVLRTIIEGYIEEDREGFVVHADGNNEPLVSRH